MIDVSMQATMNAEDNNGSETIMIIMFIMKATTMQRTIVAITA